MADRYWVGGTGTWDATTTTNWSTSSGGASGASAPTAADNVFFDSNSNVGTGAFTVTVSAAVCNDFNAPGISTALDGAMTLAMASSTLTVSGSWTNQATNFAVTNTAGTLTFNATTTGKTITTNGVTIGVNTTFNGVGGAWTLGSALNIGSFSLTLTNGTFDTSASNYALTALGILKTVSGTFTLNLNASTVSLTGTTAFNVTVAGLTLNAGTSTITCNSTGGINFVCYNATTFYNVTFSAAGTTNVTSVTFNAATTSVNSLTFNNLTFTAPGGAFEKSISFYSGCSVTVNGTLSLPIPSNATRRYVFGVTTVAGQQMTLTAATYSVFNTSFVHCAVIGTALTGTSIGDAGGNSNITFTAPKTVYWSLSAGGTVISTAYALTSGGSPAVANFPLPQDTLVFDDAGLSASTTISLNVTYRLPGIDASTRTLTMTLAMGTTSSYICGNINWPASVIITASTGSLGLVTIGSNTINTVSATRSVPAFQVAAIGYNNGTIKLLQNFTHSTVSNVSSLHARGTIDLNGFVWSCPYYTVQSGLTGTNTAVLAFGAGGALAVRATQSSAVIINLGSTSWSYTGTGTIRGNASNGTAFTILNAAGQSLPTIGLNGTATVTISNSCTIADVAVVTAGVACGLKLTSGITVTCTNFTLTGSAGFLASITATTAGTRATLTKASGTVSCDYLSIQDSSATGGATWYAGANSTNVSNNLGWLFTAPPAPPAPGGQTVTIGTGITIGGGITFN